MFQQKLFKVTRVAGVYAAPPIHAPLMVRAFFGDYNNEHLVETATVCGSCGELIEIGEQYFILDEPYCLGCVEFE